MMTTFQMHCKHQGSHFAGTTSPAVVQPCGFRTVMAVAETSVNPGVAESHGRATESSISQDVKLTLPMPSRKPSVKLDIETAAESLIRNKTNSASTSNGDRRAAAACDSCIHSLEFTPGFILKATGEQEGASPQLLMKRQRSNCAEFESPLCRNSSTALLGVPCTVESCA